ncbi:MAG: metallophosphoesterase [Phycisphaeraceae bacterium]|nr:metallophosphoesterase [Phycisphaeraceae bacterium]
MAVDLTKIEIDGFERVLAISDIHGDVQALEALLKVVNPTQLDLIITLGDYVDRGHFSAQVIDLLIDLHRSANVYSLRGNHDQWMIDAKDDEDNADFWLTIGGTTTLASYEEESVTAIPDAHWKFLIDTCVDIIESEKFIFVHGHLEHDVPLSYQRPEIIQMLQYQNALPHESGKIIVCGHSSTKSGTPEDLGHTIAVETKSWLNCVDVVRGTIWRADSNGLTDQHFLI